MKRRLLLGVLVVALLAPLPPWFVASALVAPNPSEVGELPRDLVGEPIEILSASGSALRAWFVPGQPHAPAVLLLHGLHGSRRAMLDRARWLRGDGYTVLLFDFQAHGESPGERVTFGYLESMDAAAAVDYLRRRVGDARIGAIGVSMGAAAALLADPPLPIDALVVEEVYPTLDEAVADRIAMRLGAWGATLSPLLTLQVPLRFGVSANWLRPIDRAARLTVPKLFIAGTEDAHTTIAESEAIFATAADTVSP